MIACNRGTLDLLGAAMEVWMAHLVDSANNSQPVRGRDGLGWGTPMSPEFRSVIKTVAFGWRPHFDGMGAPKLLYVTAAARAPVPTPDLARELTERFFGDFPELRGAKCVGRVQDEYFFETPREKLTETGRTSYEGKTFQTPRELTEEQLRENDQAVAYGRARPHPTRETMTPVARAEVVRVRACASCYGLGWSAQVSRCPTCGREL